jgi:tetratricopeptide (TPR) repeat protein
MTSARPLGLALTAVLAAAAPSARAEPPVSPLARQLSDQGRGLHDLGDYDQAIVAYKHAYLIAPSPGLLFNIAQAYRLAGDCSSAAAFYRRYLATSLDPGARRLALRNLALADACAERALPRPDARAVHAHASSGGAADPGAGERHLGMAVAGIGAVALAGGVYFALDARNAGDQVTSAYAHGGTWQSVADLDARGHRSADLATGLFIAGGAAVATGVVLYVLGRRDEHVPAIAIGAHGAEVELAWRF